MKKHILWEKYENYVHNNWKMSQLLFTGKILKSGEDHSDNHNLLDNSSVFNSLDDDDDDDEEEDDDEDDDNVTFMRFPITPELMQSIKLSSNFECWMGHTNFDITNNIKDQIEEVEGVEILKILTRYRFLVGIGKTFTLTTVRSNIYKTLGITTND